MKRKFTAKIRREGKWFIGFCPEVPEANGQGRDLIECRENLTASIKLILKDRSDANGDAPTQLGGS